MRILDFADGFESSTEPTVIPFPASSVSNTPSGNVASTTVQDAINELQGDIDALNTDMSTVDAHIANTFNPHAVTKAQIGLSNVDNTSDSMKNSAVATVTNKTFGDAPTFTQVATPSTPASGFNKIYPKSDGNFYTLNSSGIETQVGSGAGGGSKNYLGTVNNVNLNGNFELGSTTGWSLAHTTLDANKIPNQASGSWTAASGNLSFTAVTSGKLAGNYSGSLASSAASVAGDMLVSNAFTLELEDQAKVQTFKAYYSPTLGASNLNFSGTSSNTHAIYIYDVTNGTWIQPTGVYGMTQGSGVGYVTGTFQTTSNGTQYRLAVVNINASAGAFTMLFDDFALGPQTVLIGAVIVDIGTETWTDNQANATTSVKLQRDGARILAEGITTFTGAMSGGFTITIPAAYTASSFYDFTGTKNYLLDEARLLDQSAVAGNTGQVIMTASNTLAIAVENSAGTYGAGDTLSATVPFTWASGDSITWKASWYVSGWSSNVQMSDGTDARVVEGIFQVNTTQAISINTVNTINFNSTVKDTHGAWNGSTTYTIPVTDFYDFSTMVYRGGLTYVATGSQTQDLSIYINGISVRRVDRTTFATAETEHTLSGTTGYYCNAGDLVTVRLQVPNVAGAGGTIAADGGLTWFVVKRVSGSSVIASPGTVAFRAYSTSGESVPTSEADFLPSTIEDNSHGAYSASTGFTVPVSGRYTFKMKYITQPYSTTGTLIGRIQKDGTNIENATIINTGVNGQYTVTVVALDVRCLAGQVIKARKFVTAGTVSMTTGVGDNIFEGYRVGNY